MSRQEEIRQGLFEHTLNGRAPEVKALTEEALQLGMDPMDLLFKALIPSLEEVGRRFELGDFFVPEMLIAARAMQGALVILRPLIAETGAKPIGKYVIGTVKGDIHDIGKNLVVIMLEGAGRQAHRQVRDRHRQGGHPRHRQEPGRDHARRRRLRGRRPRRQHRPREVR
jgi:5-methyltetrahydrofolate--homocysteine methyltransferase